MLFLWNKLQDMIYLNTSWITENADNKIKSTILNLLEDVKKSESFSTECIISLFPTFNKYKFKFSFVYLHSVI